jgi:hypothetical protein
MAIGTYVELYKTTLTTATPTITFSSIPQTYTDLVIVCTAASETTSAYSFIQLYGTGSTPYGSTVSNTNQLFNSDVSMRQSTIGSTMTYHIMNYAATDIYKPCIAKQNTVSAADYMGSLVAKGLWRNNAAITSIAIKATRGGTAYNFSAGSTFCVYGIKSWTNTEASPKATGGYVYSDSSYWYHAFPFSSTFTPNQSLTADILVVAGGGGGGGFTGGNGNGGGGAGGLLAYSSQSLTATSYTCTVGAGGAGGLTASGSTNGVSSQFGALTASVGGGRGASGGSAPNGSSTGGSGGGGQGSNDLNYVNGSAGTSGQGFAGANGYNAGSFAGGGGGGGAGGAGQVAVADAIGGVGGVGATSSLINAIGSATGYGQLVSGNYYFAGGGGGSTSSNSTSGIALGGNGGGGTGYYDGGPVGGAGISALGAGGGAGRAANGGNGGSGIVVIRYAK